MKKITQLVLLFFIFCNCYSQSVQWASNVEYQQNQYGSEEYSAKQVIGKPDAELGQISPKAYRMKNEASYGALVTKFSIPQVIQQIVVVESFLPGRITEISLFDEKGSKYNVYQNIPQELPEDYRVLALSIAKTHYKVSKVEVKLNSLVKKGWCQIDAIGISETKDPIDTKATKVNNAAINIINFSTDVENLGEKVNTGETETKPIISADGKTLYFCRQNYQYNVGGKRDDQDIWYSDLQKNGQWSYAANMGAPLNDKNPNGVTSVSPDGNTLLLINEYNEDESFKPGASISHRIKGGWGPPEKLNIDKFSNKGTFLDFAMAASGKALIIAMDRFDSNGDQDLYVSFNRGENNWSEPINIGSNVNTSKAEFSPFLAADEKTLYFASEGYDGYGGSDIYYTKRLDDTWKRWSKPVNLGEKINSEEWDGYYSVSASGDYAYLVSKRKSISNSKDIYRIGLPKEYKPEAVLLVAGTVYNSKTKQPISSKIIFETLPEGKEQGIANSNPNNGSYKIVLPKGRNYGFLAQAKGYLSLEENIDLTNLKDYSEVKKDLYLVPIEIGQSVSLNNIFFVKGQAVLMETSNPELARLAKMLKDNATVYIELSGHTDNQGNADLNYELSKERVKVVKQHLVKLGVAEKRVELKAYGGSKPIASNASEETRKLNRRVEVTILKY